MFIEKARGFGEIVPALGLREEESEEAQLDDEMIVRPLRPILRDEIVTLVPSLDVEHGRLLLQPVFVDPDGFVRPPR